MKSYKNIAIWCVLAAGLAISGGPARGQVVESVVAAPIVTKVISTIAPKGTPKGTSWLKAEVILLRPKCDRGSRAGERTNDSQLHFRAGIERQNAGGFG